MSDGWIPVRGERIAYSDDGSGPVIIRAHGLTQNRHTDRALGIIDWRALVEAGFRVVSYDARGHGESSGGADPATYRWSALAMDMLAVIEHFSPEEPVRAIGGSMGTSTILCAMSLATERFTEVVLGAPPSAWDSRVPLKEMYGRLGRMAEIMSRKEFDKALTRIPVPSIFSDIPGYPGPPSTAHDLLPAIFRGAADSDLPGTTTLQAMRVPALILAWATDPAHPVAMAQRLSQLLPVSTLHISTTALDVRSWGARAAQFLAKDEPRPYRMQPMRVDDPLARSKE